MVTADLIFIAIIVLTFFCGYYYGFGRCLNAVCNGIFGVAISSIVCYFIFGVVLNMGFVQNLLAKLISAMIAKESPVLNLLVKIRIDIIIFGAGLFLVVQVLRKLFFSLLKDVFETDNKAMKITNKVLGVILTFFLAFAFLLIALQITLAIDGDNGAVMSFFSGSLFRLDKLYLGNPLNSIITTITNALPEIQPLGKI